MWLINLIFLLILTPNFYCFPRHQLLHRNKKDLYQSNESTKLEIKDFIVSAIRTPFVCQHTYQPDHQKKCKKVFQDPMLEILTTTERVRPRKCKTGYKLDYKGAYRFIFQ